LLNLPAQNVLAAGPLASGGSFIILNWIPGRDLADELGSMTRAQMTMVAQQVVNCQRRLGALPQARRCGWAPIGGTGALANWSEAFGEPCTAPLDDGTLLSSLRARLCHVRLGLEPYLATIAPVCFLDDLTHKNVLVQNGVLRGIIDVDYACYGDPLLTVGATLAGIVSNMAQPAEFYVDELIRFWNPDPSQLRAIHFYAALWLIGSLAQPDASIDLARAQRLASAADAALSRAESSGVAPVRQRIAG
jgi:aminoglycoside phosphotransferase (APT) family kinase protein